MAQNEGLDVSYDSLLDTARWNTALEQHTTFVTSSAGSEFVLQEMIDVISITIHHRNHLVEVSQNGLRTLDEDIWFGQCPATARRDIFGNLVTCSVEQ